MEYAADAEGAVRYGTDLGPGAGIDISDRDYFQRLRDHTHVGLVVSGPVLSRVDNQWSMVFARRVNNPDGSFAGAVVSVVHTEQFRTVLSAPDLGSNGTATLHTSDLRLVTRVPEIPGRDSTGSRALAEPLQAALAAEPEKGSFQAVSPPDGRERTFVYRKLPGLPLYIVVGCAPEDYLAAWWKETLELAGIVALFSAIVLGLSRKVRRSAEELARHRDHLERLVEERTAELRAAAAHFQAALEREVEERTAELQAANSQLESFLYAASHDLKGPLGRISSFSGLLERNYRDRLEGDGLLFLQFIRENALRLTRLIDDLLAHARIDQQVTHLQPISLLDAVRTILQDKAEDILERGAAVRLDVPPAEVLADAYGLKQVLDNLLENALKYSARVPEPRIEIGGEEAEGRFRLWVRDNGIGFDMAYREKIFEIFRRLHTYAEYAGSGIGLALVKRAMERMGGKVWAEGRPGQGATFFLEFRLAACEGD